MAFLRAFKCAHMTNGTGPMAQGTYMAGNRDQSGHLGARLSSYRGKSPKIHPGAFVAAGACLIGDVEVHEGASIWYNCVLRADLAKIIVGARSNVQDGSVIHVEGPSDREKSSGGRVLDTVIGQDVLIGHMALLHGCRVDDGGFVGMGAIVMDGARVEKQGLLAAGALLPPGKILPSRELWGGRPAKKMRELGEKELAGMAVQCAHYEEMAQYHGALVSDAG